MGSQQHHSDARVLDRRSLWTDHRCLAGLLVPGLSVLDVGCGTGAITKGIAEAVGVHGMVVGVDRDPLLLDRARANWASVPNLRFEERDATRLDLDARFDIVTAARTLQWIAHLRAAIGSMVRATKPEGLLVLLDYNHAHNSWDPEPPAEFTVFYSAFLSWRTSNGWDNEVADHLPALLEEAGLRDVRIEAGDETTESSHPDFQAKSVLWTEVIESIGPTIEHANACDAALLTAARDSYEAFRLTELRRQTLSMKAIVATVPDARVSRGAVA